MSSEPEAPTATEGTTDKTVGETRDSSSLKVIGWLSVGLVVAAVGFVVGRELLSRYKFNHRNPYEFYAHAGEKQSGEFGLGV